MSSSVSFEDDYRDPSQKGETTHKSQILRHSFVRGVLEESECMLREIDELRDTVTRQTEQLIAAERRIRFLEGKLAAPHAEASGVNTEAVEGETALDFDKIAILRSILDAILASQFGGCYARARDHLLHSNSSAAETATGLDDEEDGNDILENALRESNRNLDEVCHLLQSYRDTPSFSATACDQLTIECMMHVISLSKALNAAALETCYPHVSGAQWLATKGCYICPGRTPQTSALPPEPREGG